MLNYLTTKIEEPCISDHFKSPRINDTVCERNGGFHCSDVCDCVSVSKMHIIQTFSCDL